MTDLGQQGIPWVPFEHLVGKAAYYHEMGERTHVMVHAARMEGDFVVVDLESIDPISSIRQGARFSPAVHPDFQAYAGWHLLGEEK